MKANELRIGNWVKLFNDDFNKIYVISKTAIQVEGGIIGGEVFKIEHIKPIPLTKELLEKCGFLKYFDKNIFIHPKLRYLDHFKIRDDGFVAFVSSQTYIAKCEHLHQLQNLYFALIGEELNVNL